MVLGWLVLVAANAGYGDAEGGSPSPDERLLHLFTNAVRVDPEAHEAAYNSGGCSFYSDFSADEQTPRVPYLYHAGLNEVARVHSDDMLDRDYFSHDTMDGPSWDERIRPYYPSGAISENIAVGYGSVWSAVMEGWMCSETGHRGAIMSGSLVDLGAGVADRYYTQDFGGGSGQGPHQIAMGAHEEDGGQISFYADFYDATALAPERVEVILGPVRHRMDLLWGETWRGVYTVRLPTSSDCSPYAFEATTGPVTERFPEDGWYGVGDCVWDDAGAQWIAGEGTSADGGTDGSGDGGTDGDTPTGGDGGDDGTDPWDAPWGDPEQADGPNDEETRLSPSGGCTTAPVGGASWLALWIVGFAAGRRRR